MDTQLLKLEIARKALLLQSFLNPKPILTNDQIKTALLFAKISDCSYPFTLNGKIILEPLERLQSLLGPQATITECTSKIGAAGYMIKHEGMLIVAFRGTELDVSDLAKIDLRDAKMDMDFSPVPFSGGGFAHGGGVKSLDSLSDIIATLKKAPSDNLFLTGHSLGGMLAILAATRIATETICGIKGVYAFCAPKCVDDTIVDVYNRAIGNVSYCFINEIDLVPRFRFPKPPKLRLPGLKIFLPSGSDTPVFFTLFQRILSAYRGYRLHGLSLKGTTNRAIQCHLITGVVEKLSRLQSHQ